MCCVQLRKRNKQKQVVVEQGQVRDGSRCGELCGVGYGEHNAESNKTQKGQLHLP